jgi:hypothetical protein
MLLLITVVETITRERSAQSIIAETDRYFDAESKISREKLPKPKVCTYAEVP